MGGDRRQPPVDVEVIAGGAVGGDGGGGGGCTALGRGAWEEHDAGALEMCLYCPATVVVADRRQKGGADTEASESVGDVRR